MLITCKLKLFVLLIISFVVRIIATTRKNTNNTATTFIQKKNPVQPNKPAKLQVDLSSTTPTHVPIYTTLIVKSE